MSGPIKKGVVGQFDFTEAQEIVNEALRKKR